MEGPAFVLSLAGVAKLRLVDGEGKPITAARVTATDHLFLSGITETTDTNGQITILQKEGVERLFFDQYVLDQLLEKQPIQLLIQTSDGHEYKTTIVASAGENTIDVTESELPKKE